MKLNWVVKAIFAGVIQGLTESAVEKRMAGGEQEPAKRPKRKRTVKK